MCRSKLHRFVNSPPQYNEYNALSLIYSYISGRRQRTKIGTAFSKWADIILGVPQGSILGPLLFNIYINDIFFVTEETGITNYADDNTPYACDKSVELVIARLENDSLNYVNGSNTTTSNVMRINVTYY